MCDADFSQIEYRTLVALAKEQVLIDKFKDPDTDYHTMMASLMYGVDYALVTPKMRGDAKSFNFGIPYGMGFASLAILLTGNRSKKSIEEAKEKYELYFKDQPNVRRYFKEVKEKAKFNEMTETLWGRFRRYSFVDKDGKYSQKMEGRALRQAGNAVIQGCLHGDTRIQTKDLGIVKIKDVANSHRLVWDGDKWSHGDIVYSGKKQKCIITFINGQKFICSPIHKFLKADTDPYNEGNYIECQNLKPGDHVEYNRNSDLKIEEYELMVQLELPREIEYIDEYGNNVYELVNMPSGLDVESVEITDEYIDMYDVCNTDGGYYVADGIITHNTAADIFKIAVARTFLFIRNNNLFGAFYITNMVHDEQLTEIDVSKLNAQAILKNLIECMELKLDGFPPLFVGAGVGTAWAKAKGKMAEIHPDLAEQFIQEAKDMPLRADTPQNPKEVLKYFDHRVEQFRIEKIKDYLVDEKNWGQAIHPVIGNLLSLQFDFGVTDEFKSKYTEQNGYTKEEITEALKGIGTEQIKRFIEKYELDVDYRHFDLHSDIKEEEEVEEGYDEAEEYDDDGTPIEFEEESQFVLLDETNEVYGIDVRDIIKEFGIVVSKKKKICGINTSIMSFNAKDDLSDYLTSHLCDKEEPDSMEVVYLKDNNTILNTEVYVKGVSSKNLEKILGKR